MKNFKARFMSPASVTKQSHKREQRMRLLHFASLRFAADKIKFTIHPVIASVTK